MRFYVGDLLKMSVLIIHGGDTAHSRGQIVDSNGNVLDSGFRSVDSCLNRVLVRLECSVARSPIFVVGIDEVMEF